MPDYGQQVYDAGMRYRENPTARALYQGYQTGASQARPGDDPAAPVASNPSPMRDFITTSASQLGRIPHELGANLMDLASKYWEPAAKMAASNLPGGGLVQSVEDFGHGRDEFKQGNYVNSALNYLQGFYNAGTDVMPFTPTLAMAPFAMKARAPRSEDAAILYGRNQPVAAGQKTGYSKVKHDTPFEEMTRTVVDDPANKLKPDILADLSKLVGGYGLPLVGDRTEAGKILTHINDQRLAHDVHLGGGFQYPQSAASVGPDKSGWASHAAQINGLHERVLEAQRIAGDKPVYGIFSGMGERSGDFSHMNADALLGMIPSSGMGGNSMGAFDQMLRERLGEGAASWPGLANIEAARGRLLDPKGGELRKSFVETADTKAARELGMPDVAAVRKATTHPSFHDWSTGASGGSIVRFEPGGVPITDPAIPHGTYPMQYPGSYVGRTPVHVDRNEMFPDVVAQQFGIEQGGKNAGKPREWRHVDRAFMINGGLLQKLDNRWLDTVSSAIERRQRGY